MSANLKDKLALVAAGSGKSALDGLRAKPKAITTTPTPAPIPPVGNGQCLLLDVSGSMAEDCEPGRSKWTAMRALLTQFFGVKLYAFSASCAPCSVSTLPPPTTTTNMGGAFRTVKRAQIGRVILITDGIPDDEADALRAAAGLKLDIFYVGPHPRPPFLDQLAATCSGTARTASLAQQKTIAAPIKALLALPAPKESK